MKKLLYIIVVLFFALSSCTQQKEISQARQWIKNGNNLGQAESSMRKLLEDSVNWNRVKIWQTLFEAVKKQYEQGNEKLYLHQQYDTAQLFFSAKKMFDILESFDSIHTQAGNKEKPDLRYRAKHSSFLHQFRPNLFSGGIFFVNKKNYEQAYSMFNTYIDCAFQPLFEQYDFLNKDKRIPEAAYWIAYCGFNLKNPDLVLKYDSLALKDKSHQQFMLQYLAEAYKAERDTDQYLHILETGFEKYPEFPFFFPRLIEYYESKGMAKRANSVVDKAISQDRNNSIYWVVKSTLLLNSQQYGECIRICDSLLAINDTLPDLYLNAGLSYYNVAASLEKNLSPSNSSKKKVLEYYRRALPYMRQYRKLAPEKEDKWSLPLYYIYLNLNMEREFNEINRIILSKNKKSGENT